MRPEEWRKGMENEAASAEDGEWRRETRRAARHAWVLHPWGELRALLLWSLTFTVLTVLLFVVMGVITGHVAALGEPAAVAASETGSQVLAWSVEASLLTFGFWMGLVGLGGFWLALRGHTLLTALGGFVLPAALPLLLLPQDEWGTVTAMLLKYSASLPFLLSPLLPIAGGWVGGHLFRHMWRRATP